MSRNQLRPFWSIQAPVHVVIVIFLFTTNVLFQIVANSGFKLSTMTGSTKGFLGWQVIGNLAGLASVLTITGLLHYLPLSIVFPITTGLTVIGLQIVASRLLFHESISTVQWLGTALVITGIALIGARR